MHNRDRQFRMWLRLFDQEYLQLKHVISWIKCRCAEGDCTASCKYQESTTFMPYNVHPIMAWSFSYYLMLEHKTSISIQISASHRATAHFPVIKLVARLTAIFCSHCKKNKTFRIYSVVFLWRKYAGILTNKSVNNAKKTATTPYFSSESHGKLKL